MTPGDVRDDLPPTDSLPVLIQKAPGRSRPGLVLVAVGLTTLISTGVLVAAVLAPAPPASLPWVVAICVGGPLFAAGELHSALAAVRADRRQRAHGKALARLQRTLDELPETEHPLGL